MEGDVVTEPDQSLEDWQLQGLSKWVCKADGCETHTPVGDNGRKRYYCDEHQHLAAHAKKDRPPGSVKIQIGPEKATPGRKASELEQVQARAQQLAQMIALLVMSLGQAEDANDILKGSEAWAAAVKNLAQYEDWLRKLAAGGETAGRATAWITVLMATLAMLTPILLRHGAVPDGLRPIAEAMSGTS